MSLTSDLSNTTLTLGKNMASILSFGVRRLNQFSQGSLRRLQSTFAKEWAEEETHALKTMATWKLISLFVAIPGIGVVTYSSLKKEQAHLQHLEEHGHPEFIPYAHLRIRSKPFPWGDGNHSLFHNPHTNPLPEGYEESL